MIPDLVDLGKPIYGKALNVGWLLDSLRSNDKLYQKLHGNRAIKDVTFYDVSGGKGFLSVVLRCTLKFVDSDDSYHTILKVPGTESMQKEMEKLETEMENVEKIPDEVWYAFLTDSHKFECDFYHSLAPLLDTPCPKVYKMVDYKFGEKEGVIHMEDLTLRGKIIPYFENINLTQVKCMIRLLAHMHKNTLSLDPKTWHGKYVRNQEAMLHITKNLKNDPFLNGSARKDAFATFNERLEKFYLNPDYAIYASKKAHIDLGMPSVLVHGDMHSGNIMWGIDEEGNIQNELAALVDWQIMHEGSPMSDLARFLTHCADGVVRRQAETFAVEYYFECLIKEFGNDASKVPYNIEQLKKAYNFCFLSQAFYAAASAGMLFHAIADRAPTKEIKNAYHDFAIQKALHLFEDADQLLQGEMKEVFEKYNV